MYNFELSFKLNVFNYKLIFSFLGFDLILHIRAFHSATILLAPSPSYPYPNVKITLQSKLDGYSRISVELYPDSIPKFIAEQDIPEVVDYWQWKAFQITIFSDKLLVYMTKNTGSHLIFDVKYHHISLAR